jgi:hypothetical protein
MQIVREDRFPRLPDDILVNILDRLNVREAARTSVLARRWRHLSAVLSRLTIDVRDFVAKPGTTCREEGIELSNAAVVEVTKSILACRVSSPYIIRSMRMAFFLRDDECISIGHAVGHIMAFYTIDIEFTIFTEKEYSSYDLDDKIDYGRRFMSFVDASLPNCIWWCHTPLPREFEIW